MRALESRIIRLFCFVKNAHGSCFNAFCFSARVYPRTLIALVRFEGVAAAARYSCCPFVIQSVLLRRRSTYDAAARVVKLVVHSGDI